MAPDPLLTIAEELYALPPGEFTGTRNAWAKQTRADGDRDLAAQVAELRKPSTAAWVVNMMVRHQGDQMAQVLDLGASLRQAQADLDGDALRELARQRRQLTAAVTHQGRVLAGELGQKVTDAVAEQVRDTLHAAMVDEQAAAAVRSGLLVAALAATGVGTDEEQLAAAVAVPAAIGMTARARSQSRTQARTQARSQPRPMPDSLSGLRAGSRDAGAAGRGELTVVPEPVPDEDEARLAREAAAEAARRAAQERVEAARVAADEAHQRVRKAEKRVGRVQARTLQAAAELDQVRRRVAELEHQLEGLDDETAAAQDKQQRAERRSARAREDLAAAEAEQASLGEAP